MSHCNCPDDERDTYTVDDSPAHFDGETLTVKCHNCGGLVSVH